MREASSVDVQRNFPAFREIAEGRSGDGEAVTVLHYNKPSVVIVSAVEYARLKRRDKQVMLTEDVPDWLAERIAGTEMHAKFDYLNDVV